MHSRIDWPYLIFIRVSDITVPSCSGQHVIYNYQTYFRMHTLPENALVRLPILKLSFSCLKFLKAIAFFALNLQKYPLMRDNLTVTSVI